MATPQFILDLREKIGHAPLWLTGVSAVVVRDDEVLLVRRADNGSWTPVGGIVDPGEQPAAAAVREVLEETGLVVEPVRLVSVNVTPMITYANGDQVQYIDLCFLCRWVSGDPHPADGENTEAVWVHRDRLPEMKAQHMHNLRHALSGAQAAFFTT